jgi:hypothetical protein
MAIGPSMSLFGGFGPEKHCQWRKNGVDSSLLSKEERSTAPDLVNRSINQ